MNAMEMFRFLTKPAESYPITSNYIEQGKQIEASLKTSLDGCEWFDQTVSAGYRIKTQTDSDPPKSFEGWADFIDAFSPSPISSYEHTGNSEHSGYSGPTAGY